MRQEFMVSVLTSIDGYEVAVSGEDVGVAHMSAPDLDQALRMAATFMQTCCEEALRLP